MQYIYLEVVVNGKFIIIIVVIIIIIITIENTVYVTLHGKTGKKVMTRARVRWHGTLSVTYDTDMRI